VPNLSITIRNLCIAVGGRDTTPPTISLGRGRHVVLDYGAASPVGLFVCFPSFRTDCHARASDAEDGDLTPALRVAQDVERCGQVRC
jgi:hypothetical protein